MAKTPLFTDNFAGSAGTDLATYDANYHGSSTFKLDGTGGIYSLGGNNVNYRHITWGSTAQYIRFKFMNWTYGALDGIGSLCRFALRVTSATAITTRLDMISNTDGNHFDLTTDGGVFATNHLVNNNDYIEFRITAANKKQLFINDIQIGSDVTETGNLLERVAFGFNFNMNGEESDGPITIAELEVGILTSDIPADPTSLTASCAFSIGETQLPGTPVSNFTADVTSGLSPLTVQFTDHSTETPTSWLWETEAGTLSTSQNPSHVFETGSHVVRLTASNAQGSGTPYQMTIMAYDPPLIIPPTGGTVYPVRYCPPGVTVDSSLGKIAYYVVDTVGNEVRIYDPDGTLLKTFGGLGSTNGKFWQPTTACVVS